jgi:hypothetical protein
MRGTTFLLADLPLALPLATSPYLTRFAPHGRGHGDYGHVVLSGDCWPIQPQPARARTDTGL